MTEESSNNRKPVRKNTPGRKKETPRSGVTKKYRNEKSEYERPRREETSKKYPAKDRNGDRPQRSYRDERSEDQNPRSEESATRAAPARREGPPKRYTSNDRNRDRPARNFRDEKSENQKPRRDAPTSKKPLKDRKSDRPAGRGRKKPALSLTNYDTLRLNKYIANAGICSRREADELIKTGLVEVDGKAITEMGYKVKPGQVVKYAGEKITPEKPVYFLLNKPKDYSSEMKLTADRKSALTLLKGIGKHSVAPIGKLGRSTTGLILYTNDGEIAGKLANPKGGIKKIYHVFLDKNLRKEDLDAILAGVEVEGAIIKADDISYVGTAKDKKQLGIELRSNQNKAVRSLFKQLGYYIVKLDRVMYADLTKKDLPRGKWRPLTDQELVNLKMLK